MLPVEIWDMSHHTVSTQLTKYCVIMYNNFTETKPEKTTEGGKKKSA